MLNYNKDVKWEGGRERKDEGEKESEMERNDLHSTTIGVSSV